MEENVFGNSIIESRGEEIGAQKLGTVGAYAVYVDREKRNIRIYTTEYYPGVLVINKEGLEKLLANLK